MTLVRVLGRGRAGGALAAALERAGIDVEPAAGRGPHVAGAAGGCDVLVLAVPDALVAAVAAAVAPVPGTLVVHLAGSLTLDVLAPHERRASFHPLVPLPDPGTGAARLVGAWAAVAGDPGVGALAAALGARTFTVADEDRAAYHAAAAISANHLVALCGQVERIADRVGVPLGAYLELAQAALDQVGQVGPAAALTGPVARGDWTTVRAHLSALAPGEQLAYRALAAEAARLAGRAVPDDLAP